MNALFEKLVGALGTTPVIVLHVVWWVVWFLLGADKDTLLLIVSFEAILLALFILRGQKAQQDRMERNLRKDLRATTRIEKKLK